MGTASNLPTQNPPCIEQEYEQHRLEYWDGVEQRCVACSLCASPLLEVRTPCSTFADTECGDTDHVRIQQGEARVVYESKTERSTSLPVYARRQFVDFEPP